MPLASFHPAVREWFEGAFPGGPTACQAAAWPAIGEGRHALIAAPTGSGKTLAAFLAAIDALVRKGVAGRLEEATEVVYVSPLKALGNDVERNLQRPLEGILERLRARGLPEVAIRTLVRTGDTPEAARAAMRKRPPHILVTTPESLYILLTSESGRRMLASARTAIVDEIHAVAGGKRGAHLALSLERLAALAGRRLVRIGLSATQRPIEAVASLLTGRRDDPCTVVDLGHRRALDLALELPDSLLETVMSGEVWEELYDRLAALVAAHRTTLVFVNTRRLAERVTRHLGERLGADAVTSHHGSLSRESRHAAEARLRAGELRALVATASLELGIDVGQVDLVCQLGSTRSIATWLQRAGRSGHAVGGLPKGRLFPLSRDELVECAALLDAVGRGELDRLSIPEHPLDVLAQQMVAAVACEPWSEDALFALCTRAWPYRNLPRARFDQAIEMLAGGFATRRGRGAAYLHRDAVNGILRPRRGARLAAITSGGAIPDNADYDVVLEPEGTFVGTLNEDFAIESLPGDIFQLGASAWRILRIESGKVRVEDAAGQPPSIPFWLGEAPGRSDELSQAVSRLRAGIDAALAAHPGPEGRAAVAERLARELALAPAAAAQLVDYLAAARAALGVLPTRERLVLERFFDESGGQQLVIHAPYGSRVNRAFGLALRKRICRRFNFELQAAATEDAIVLSLGEGQSFPLQDVARFIDPASVREVLTQALLDAPVFTVRWRWNATVALAVPRFRAGRKVAPPLQRMRAEELLAAVFPESLACAENLAGRREVPDHPLVRQTLADGLEEAMDARGLERLLEGMAEGRVEVVARELSEPSPLAQSVLNARPYAFLDDAPLEERRTQAVMSRRWLDPESAADLGRLDPEAIERVRAEAWPDAQSPDELHDALLVLGFVTEAEGERNGWRGHLEGLLGSGRAGVLEVGDRRLWVAAERAAELRRVHPGARFAPAPKAPRGVAGAAPEPEAALEPALIELVRGRLGGLGPVRVEALAADVGLETKAIERALAALEAEGSVMQGRFTPDATAGAGGPEWCERRLLARIHRYTVSRLRAAIEPVSSADFMRFLLAWQHLSEADRLEGEAALEAVLAGLEGFEAPAAAWEGDLLPARIRDYEPGWLDALCLSGRYLWLRRSSPSPELERRLGPVRTTPVALLSRRDRGPWLELATRAPVDALALSSASRRVLEALAAQGALFFDELVAETGLLRTQVEGALGELAAAGLVTSDSFAGLRALLLPSDRRRPIAGARRRRRAPAIGLEDGGRWSWITGPAAPASARLPGSRFGEAAVEHAARALLRRYGVVAKRLLAREQALPPWRDLVRVYRRLEGRGEIRGGRFVAGLAGEQYATPEAVGRLREVRKQARTGELVSLSGADPLNLVGLLTPGPRLPALAGNRVLYRDGAPVALLAGREVQFLERLAPETEWRTRNELLRKRMPEAPGESLGRRH